jgi:hypothetical protein
VGFDFGFGVIYFGKRQFEKKLGFLPIRATITQALKIFAEIEPPHPDSSIQFLVYFFSSIFLI